jgi:plastocyanin/DNA/RNA endonuclease YhcR with UshA esterase domain
MRKLFTAFLTVCALQLLATNHQIETVSGNLFRPSLLVITVGDTVTWTNTSLGFHNVNGTTTTFPANPVSFGNGAAGTSAWTYSFTFNTAGTYIYQCDPHSSSMLGTIVVQAAVTATCSNLIISEYLEGSSNNKAVEIYNPTSAAINLSGYMLELYTNGSNTPSSNSFTFPNKMLASGDVYVIANSGSVAAILAVADTTSSVTFYNGDDALALKQGTTFIDVFGVLSVDPGSNWPVGTGATNEFTLVRKNTVNKGQINWAIGATEWDVHPSNTTTFLGSHSSVCGGTVVTPGLPTYTFDQLNNVNANGELDSLNVVCYVKGYVSGGNLRTSGVEFWMIDSLNGAGALVRSTSFAGYTVAHGDKLRVRGTVNQFRGLFQFVPDSIWVLNSNNTLPMPTSVTSLTEAEEGKLIVMNNMTVVSGWPNAGSSGNVVVSDGTNTFTLRINNTNTFISDSIQPAPAGLINIIGHGSQFAPTTTAPFVGGYQIQPRTKNDIVPVVVTSPTVNFPSGAQTVSEGIGAVTITMPVNPVAASAQTVKVYVSNGSGITTGDYTTTPAAVSDTIVLTVAAGDSAEFIINVLDDQITELPETITFTIAKVTSGLLVGPVATHAFTIADNDVFIPTYPIPVLRTLNANFLPDSLGVMCKVVGTVLGVDMQGTGSSNVSFTIHDGSVGYGVFMAGSTYTVTEGDQVRIIGTVGHFNGLAQINADSIAFISANNTLPAPKVVSQISETTESDLVRFNNCYIINSAQWTNSGSGFSVDVTNGTDTLVLRVDKDVTDVFAAPAPIGNFDLIGIGGQFDNSAPHNSGYQLLPRYLADIVLAVPLTYDLAITEIMPGSNDPDPNINQDWFEITNYGTTPVDLAGFSWDDDSEVPGTVVLPSVVINAGQTVVVWMGNTLDLDMFKANWGINGSSDVTVITADDMIGTPPGLGQGGDAVVLYDTSATPIEICKAAYASAAAGISVEFDTNCTYLGNAVIGVRGAYASNGNDVGSPGNVTPAFGLEELSAVGIKVYPNPASENVTIELPQGNKVISLFNITGVEVLHLETLELQQNLNVGQLPSGVYMLRIAIDGKQAIGKLVKH